MQLQIFKYGDGGNIRRIKPAQDFSATALMQVFVNVQGLGGGNGGAARATEKKPKKNPGWFASRD